MRLRPRSPAERVRGELTPMADELAEGAAIYAPPVGGRHLDRDLGDRSKGRPGSANDGHAQP